MFAMPMRIVMPIPVAVMILTLRHQREHRPGSARARDKALREAFYSCCAYLVEQIVTAALLLGLPRRGNDARILWAEMSLGKRARDSFL